MVPAGNGLAVGRHPGIRGIVVVIGVACGSAESVHDVGRGGKIRIADTQIDDVHAFFLLLCFHLINPCKKIRREIAHAC